MKAWTTVLAGLVLALLAASALSWRLAPAARADLRPRAIGYRVDLNSADAAALSMLPGVGPGKARAIVADRAARGPFAVVDDLARVRGIGPKTVEAIRPYALCRH